MAAQSAVRVPSARVTVIAEGRAGGVAGGGGVYGPAEGELRQALKPAVLRARTPMM